MIAAHELGKRRLRRHSSRFSRRDFTLPQLFACLVFRDLKNLSFRRAEVELADSRGPAAIGMRKVPDHATLHRAWKLLVRNGTLNRLLDEQVRLAGRLDWLARVAAVDTTYFEPRHASGYYKRRCRRAEREARAGGVATRAPPRDVATRATVKATPKLGLGVDAASGFVLSATATTGMGSDSPLFEPLVYHAWRRHTMSTVVLDAGFDGEHNHELARRDMGVRSIVPPRIGRPSKDAAARRPRSRWRRRMYEHFRAGGGGVTYRKRAAVECVNSMIKRNQGSDLRARTTKGREMEMLLKAIVHNTMLLRRRSRGSRQSRRDPFSLPDQRVETKPSRHLLS
jgi:hypothetical protein